MTNCMEGKCVHCKAKKEPCELHLSSGKVVDWILVPYCEAGKKVKSRFNDNKKPMFCERYER